MTKRAAPVTTGHDGRRTEVFAVRVDNAKILCEREAILRQARIDTIQKGARAPVNPDGSVVWTAGKR